MYQPSDPHDLAQIHKFVDMKVNVIFVGYDENAGGQQSGDYLVLEDDIDILLLLLTVQ